jgi:hypothetical protein
LSFEKTYFVVLRPPPREVEVAHAATRLLGLFGSTAMCSSASGKVLVGVTMSLGVGAEYPEPPNVATTLVYGLPGAWGPPLTFEWRWWTWVMKMAWRSSGSGSWARAGITKAMSTSIAVNNALVPGKVFQRCPSGA